MTLNDAETDKLLTILSLDESNKSELKKLTAMGILPGVRLTLLQKKPVPVFQIGYGRFAIDESLAGRINVR